MRTTGLLLLAPLLWGKAACAGSAGRFQQSSESSVLHASLLQLEWFIALHLT